MNNDIKFLNIERTWYSLTNFEGHFGLHASVFLDPISMTSGTFVCCFDPKVQWSIGRTNCLYYSTRVDLHSHQILLSVWISGVVETHPSLTGRRERDNFSTTVEKLSSCHPGGLGCGPPLPDNHSFNYVSSTIESSGPRKSNLMRHDLQIRYTHLSCMRG